MLRDRKVNNENTSTDIRAYIVYPFMMIMGLSFHQWLLVKGFSVPVAMYVPVLLAAAIITFLEWQQAYRKQWHPQAKEVASDVAYMMLVQIVLARLLTFTVIWLLLKNVDLSLNGFRLSWWPYESPVMVQAILMILVADFLRYWLHRFSHQWEPLWRLHAVHHSSHRLYWVNVGRFHPLEKVIQFFFDAMPFLLLSLSENVLAWYYVFYAINGFMQHCNIKMYLGPLNYLISGPELHRWHHSITVEESNHNYGNNLIVWDILFGTRYLPKKREVDVLGLRNRNYPLAFVSQIAAPFQHNPNKDDG